MSLHMYGRVMAQLYTCGKDMDTYVLSAHMTFPAEKHTTTKSAKSETSVPRHLALQIQIEILV